jgi:tRNA modification GTPase
MMPGSSSFACELTPPGRGAVAVIALNGDAALLDPFFRARNRRPMAMQPVKNILLGDWGTASTEDVVVIRLNDTSTEIQCHGGRAAVGRILADLASQGATIISPADWLERTIGPLQSECQQTLRRAVTVRTAHHLLRQCQLLPPELQTLSTRSLSEQRERIKSMLHWGEFGLHLTQPWKVVLCGRPNVGKSSLMNALLGFGRSVVFDQPGTTRDVVASETAFDGWPVELLDTAGLREGDSALEIAGIGLARQRLSQADAIVLVLDASAGLLPEDRELLAGLNDPICIWNKMDIAASPHGALFQSVEALPVSALTNQGLEKLVRMIVDRLVPAEPSAETPVPVTASQIASLQERLATLDREPPGR